MAFYTLLKPKRNIYYDVKIVHGIKDIDFDDKNDKTNYLIIIGCSKGCNIKTIEGDDLIKLDLNEQKLTKEP